MLCAGLSDSSSKVQVSAVNILNLSLSQPDAAAELASYLQAEESTLLAALSGMLDHSLALLRAKALATIMLLCRWVDHPFSILLKGRACDMCVHFHRSALRRLLFGLKVLEGGCGTQGVGVKLVKLASYLDVDQDNWLGPPCAASTCQEQLGFPVMAEVLPPPSGLLCPATYCQQLAGCPHPGCSNAVSTSCCCTSRGSQGTRTHTCRCAAPLMWFSLLK